MMKTAWVAVVCLLASTAMANELVSFGPVDSQAAPGVMSYMATVTGGFSMGSLDWDGLASPINPATFGSELLVDISGPLGSAFGLGLGTGGTFDPGTSFSGSTSTFLGGGDPAGNWTFDFYESFDDGGDGLPDATWNPIDFTFNTAAPFNLEETYTDLSSFQADLASSPAPLTEDFNIYNYGDYQDPSLLLSNSDFSAELSAANNLFSGNNDMSTNVATDELVIDVSDSPTPVTMIGGEFYGGDFDANPIPAEVTITLQDGSTESYMTDGPAFRGFRVDPSTPITAISIATEDPAGALVWPTVDNLVVGTVVPEPGSITLLAFAGALFFMRRRR